MGVEYPLFSCELDDSSMKLIESEDRIFSYLEEIDVMNGEYVFWDASGGGVSIEISKKGKVTGPLPAPVAFPIVEAFAAYAKSKGIALDSTAGPPLETWTKIQEELRKRPKERGILARIFGRSRR
jgi:hypothetical protein